MTKDMDIKLLFGKKIKNFRIKRGFTQEQLSEKIDICERNLSKIECGKSFVTAETLSKILQALNIKIDEFFKAEDSLTKEEIKQELVNAIQEESIDINIMYRFYTSIK